MYYFLAIVKKKDMLRGNIVPSYILCRSGGTKDTRSPWRVVQPGSNKSAVPKVLVTSVSGHEEMIDFLSCYRTRDKMFSTTDRRRNGKKTRKYYPEGGLFWFPCDIEGRQRGPALFVKRVPDPSLKSASDEGFERLKRFLARKYVMSEVLTRDPRLVKMEHSAIKPKLKQ